ncbi:MAG: hypothetical protein WCO26_19245 [Deltaproteobacteria bacterium]
MARRPKTAQALAFRARLILSCVEGKKNSDVAAAFGVTRPTVGKGRTDCWDGLLTSVVPKLPAKSAMRMWSE